MFVCKKCKERKPSSDFYRHSAMAIGFLSFCKECVKARVRLHRADNIDRIQEYDRERGLLPHRKAGVAARAHRYQRSARIMGSPSFEVGTTSETPLTQISLKG